MELFQQRDYEIYRQTLKTELPIDVIELFNRWIDWKTSGDLAVLETSSELNLINIRPTYGEEDGEIDCMINLKRLNDIRYVNKFLEAVNRKLHFGGTFIGCVETSGQRRKRLMAKYTWPLNKIYFFFDYLVKRVWPKLPYLKRSYFLITAGRNRVISEMETYGRLYSCGFKLLESVEAGGRLYFAAQKVKKPDYNMEASYGPVIRLRRVGWQGKEIKVYKFRTMYPYSEYIQEFIYERCGLQKGGKIKNDPRVSELGQFMRKYWVDEIPMMINLIKGDIKLFGVRPISSHYLSLYPKEFQEYRKGFKPGLLPPVYLGLPKGIEEVMELEKKYLEEYERRPFSTDLRYTFKVIHCILFKKIRSH